MSIEPHYPKVGPRGGRRPFPLPSMLRMNVLLYNLLSVFKRVGLPEEMHDARSKRLRFPVLNTAGKVVRHARETLLRCADALARTLADAPRVAFRLLRPALAGRRDDLAWLGKKMT